MNIVIYKDFYTRIKNDLSNQIIVLENRELAKKVYDELKKDICYFDVRII